MSYLDTPRLHFSGRFQADVSTVNNDPEHFDDARFLASYQELQTPAAPDGWWNPTGSGAWRLASCVVGQVERADGASTPHAADPAIGAVLAANLGTAPAKLVDLDPEQQMVSMIFGMTVALLTSDGTPIVVGRFTPVPFENIWVRFPAGQPDSFFSATYQSTLTDLVWGLDVGSLAIDELRATTDDDALSIHFTVDGIDQDATSPTFTWGRIVGTIGPYVSGEPQHFTADRVMTPVPQPQVLNNAPFRLDATTGTLVVDLGNSLPTTSAGGPLQDLGVLHVVTHDGPEGPPIVLASVDTSSNTLNIPAAGIVTVTLAGEALSAALANPLTIVDPSGTVQLAERHDGRYVRADDDVFRIYPVAPEDVATTTLYATMFGVRTEGATITAWMDNSAMEGQVTQGPIPGPPVGVPKDGIAIGTMAPTGPDGTTVLTITGKPPGNPRGYIDGQVYGVGYGWDGDGSTTAGNELSVLVFDAYEAPETPTWTDDVGPILTQYANLYPVMKTIVDLSSYHSVRERWEMVDLGLNLPIDDPNSMPVTRDLSPGKRR